jgi:hypothetical protein
MMTTSDKELLELAAKATGLNLDWDSYTAMNLHRPMASFKEANWFAWNPLTDDGDALRLAVKLKLLVNVTDFFTAATNGHEGLDEMLHGNDPYAATRRAIVRAAAEIGESM